MKKNMKFLSVALVGLIMASCSGETKTSEAETNEVESKKPVTCMYSYSSENTELNFTAYKFLGKTGVGGTFTNVIVKGEESQNAQEVIESLSFKIPISSISTKDEGRDAKIEEHFFGTINTSEITGEVVGLDSLTNTMQLKITMNEVSNDITAKYTLKDGVFTIDAEIDVNDWNGNPGIVALNEVCKELHTDVANGDTESKLWPDVSISFSTELKENCD